jgi:hypothetical protein
MSRHASSAEPLALAEQAHALVQTDPRAGLAAAERALGLAREHRDGEAEVAALHALGFARYALGDPGALGTIRTAVRLGERNGNGRRAALARRNLALYLTYAGKSSAALREIETACAALDGLERARSEVFRIAVYGATGQAPAGLGNSARALRTLRRAGDRVWEARLRYNRGVLFSEVGDLRAATRDLEAARDLYAEVGADAAVADAEIKLARLRLLEGRPLESLRRLDGVDVEPLSDWAAGWLYLTRAEVHLALQLLPEARADLAHFVDLTTRARATDSVSKARLDAARLALLAGDAESAAALAAGARRSFAASHQPSHWARAAVLAVAAAAAGGAIRPSTLRSGLRAADVLAEQGHLVEELRARQLVARAAAHSGALGLARRQADLAAPLRSRGPVGDRVGFWHVEGLLRRASGDVRGAERALRHGLGLVEEYRGALGAVELRATASGLGVPLAESGLRMALGEGEPGRFLLWAEQLRANALRLPLLRPPRDARLRARQTELRRVDAQVRDAEELGRPVRGLVARQVELETLIRGEARRAGGTPQRRAATLRLRDATQTLGERALAEYVELDGGLKAVTLLRGRVALHDLGRAAVAATELEWLRVALSRLARGGGDRSRRAASLASASAAAEALDGQLVRPLLGELGAAPLIVVPTGGLHALPWGALPSLRGRPVAVTPSLSLWLDLKTRPQQRRTKVALVAGPGLRQAAREVRELGALYPCATILDGADAAADAVLRALDGAALAHVACHGRFRADSPLFSALELADGPVTAIDLQRLRRAPDVLVLSACELGLSDRRPGDELLGLAAAVLATGTRSLVASVVPVPDAATRRLMVAFHRELADGVSPAAALARTQAGARSPAVAGFVCVGAD